MKKDESGLAAALEVVPTTTAKYGRPAPVFPQPRPWTQWRGTCAKRFAAPRCAPLPDGRRDPDEPVNGVEIDARRTIVATSCFGLTPDEIEANRARLVALGWFPGEIDMVLGEVAS